MKKKNILWIMTDQHKFEALSLYKKIPGLTPNIDKLAGNGFNFTNCYTPSPVCGPARASLFTGLYPAETGMVSNNLPLKEKLVFLPEKLKALGYRTGMAGKLHLTPPGRRFGFDRMALNDAPYTCYDPEEVEKSDYIKKLRLQFSEQGKDDPVKMFDDDESSFESDIRRFISGSNFRKAKEHDAVWVTDEALGFLTETKKKDPFFYYLSYFGPHQPYDVPTPYKKYRANDISLPENYQADMSKGPVFQNACSKLKNHLQDNLTPHDYKELIAENYNQIFMIDEMIGKVIKKLKEQGLYDNTTIIFTSDHGDYLGSYGLFFKGQCYDASCKVSLIIKPAEKQSSETITDNICTIDLYSTVMEIAGNKEGTPPSSNSLVPFLVNKERTEVDVFSYFGKKKNGINSMIRRGEWKLIRQELTSSAPVYELYNLVLDPLEVNDKYKEMVSWEIIRAMQEKLDIFITDQKRQYP